MPDRCTYDYAIVRVVPRVERGEFVNVGAIVSSDAKGYLAARLVDGSRGLNLALDYLPGSVAFDPLAWQPDVELASRIVWFDAFVTNLDRTARNTNMLVWHGKLWLIDHGAALYFHHSSADYGARAKSPFPAIKDHVLLPFANDLGAADAAMAAGLTSDRIAAITALIPDDWLDDDPHYASKEAHRAAYADYFAQRLHAPRAFAEEAARCASLLA